MQLDVTEGHFTVALARTLDEYATQWEFSPDIECYECERGGSSFPLTDYKNVKLRFSTLAKWHKFGGPSSTPMTTSTRSRSATAKRRAERSRRGKRC